MPFEIEKNVPIPPIKSSRKPRPLRFPFDKMEVGDSIFIPNSECRWRGRIQATVSAYISQYRKKAPGVAFTTRTVDGGVRVWRTK